VYDLPRTPFVFDFLGTPNVLPGYVSTAGVHLAGASAAIGPAGAAGMPGRVDVYARPGDFDIVDNDPAGLSGTVVEAQRTGFLVRLTVRLQNGNGDQTVEIEIPHPDPEIRVWRSGDHIRVKPTRFSIFPSDATDLPPPPAAPVPEEIVDHAVAERRARIRG
jgi:sulfate transport system ATP-binding protein